MLTMSKTAKVVAVLIATPAILAIVFMTLMAVMFGGSPLDNNPFDDLPFNQVHWLEDAAVSDGSNRRGHMAQDVIKRLKFGTTKSEIIQMLGTPQRISLPFAPTESSYPSKVYSSSGSVRSANAAKVLGYYLGEELAMAWDIDRAELLLYLDRQDRYVGYEIGW